MTETTTQKQPVPPGGGSGAHQPRSPEFRAAADALRGLRQELFHDAFAYRPLPRTVTDGPPARLLPGRLRAGAVYAPHAVVGLAALVAFWAGSVASGTSEGPLALLRGLLCAVPVLVTPG
ncbi:hypothetical protein [Streptomyces sp. NPDC006134]|uniref:hypothetical protein n=1 Tax=Streptomyces sp. NPDC006134 TaxID=3154467 RepID=UPI0033F26CE7